jgi:prolyl-tRNA editing enzyme YbaK/EbsC (Cys-tRNA(Pro) deacylase)
MVQTLSPSAQKFQDMLRKNGWQHVVVEMPDTTRTAADAAAAIGCTVGQIVKSLIFMTRETHRPLLVAASGANRVDEARVKQLIGEAIQKADADFVREQTGYAIGGVPLVGHSQKLLTLIDQDLMNYAEIWAAAGTPHAVFMLKPQDLVEMTGGTLAEIKKISV